MNQEQLEAKSLGDLREIAKLQGVKAVSKFRKSDLIKIIMNDGVITPNVAAKAPSNPASEKPMNVAQFTANGPGVDSLIAR